MQLIKFVLGTEFHPNSGHAVGMKGSQELCQALGRTEGAAAGSARVAVAPSKDLKLEPRRAGTPCPTEQGTTPVLVPWGCCCGNSVAPLLLSLSLGSRAGKGGSGGCGQGRAGLGLCKKKGPGSCQHGSHTAPSSSFLLSL